MAEAEVAKLYTRVYSRSIHVLGQQMEAVTTGTTETDSIESKEKWYDRAGKKKLVKKQGRVQDIPVTETPFTRRRATASRYHVRELVDEEEKLQVLNDPHNVMAQNGVYAGRRHEDKVKIDALLGSVYQDEDNPTAVALPSGQVIAHGSAGFTMAKLRQGLKILKKAHQIGPRGMPSLVTVLWTAEQEEEFMALEEVKNADYAEKKVNEDGFLEKFMGCNFRRVEDEEDNDDGRMLPKTGNIRDCIMYLPHALTYVTRKPLYGSVDWLPEKESFQIVTGISDGAMRKEDEAVVKIECDES